MELPKDRDFLETVEGLLFCVVGYIHPPDRITAYLKYIPAEEGKWGIEGTRYSRTLPYYHITQMEKTYKFLKENYPDYLYYCPVRDIIISAVPKDRVKRYYTPQKRLKEVLAHPTDELEQKLVEIFQQFNRLSGLTPNELGVTGSILSGIHNPSFSDMDLTVYGYEASNRLKASLTHLKRSKVINDLDDERRNVFLKNRSERFPLEFKDLIKIFDRRWNYGFYRGTYFSIHPIRTDEEIIERYGMKLYRKRGVVEGVADIIDSNEAIYLPAIYLVENSKNNKGVEIKEVVSYENIFCDIYKVGERIKFKGVLEKVFIKNDIGTGTSYNRAVIGAANFGSGYMKFC